MKTNRAYKKVDRLSDWNGIKVYIGDTFCGEINSSRDEGDESKFWHTNVNTGEIRVKCSLPIKGNRVKIEFPPGSNAGLIDVLVFEKLERPSHLMVPSAKYAPICSTSRRCKCNGMIFFGKDDTWVSLDTSKEHS